ncbi:MAG: hypothetical protein K2Q22_03935, partial [Cytophagales bacterium]|nr:hypothetical protein [Cytophagales bacterium]
MVLASSYTKQEHQLSLYVNLIGIMYFCLVLFYVGGSIPFIHYPPSIGNTLLFTNKFLYFWMLSKNILITAILRMAEADTRRSSILLSVIRWIFVVNTLAGIAVMYAIPETFSFNIGSTIYEVLVLVLFEIFYYRAMKARFQLKYLWPSMFMSIKAIAETNLEQYGSALTAEQIAMNTDTYLSSFRDRSKWQFKLLLFIANYVPMLYFKPLFTHMSIEKREKWLKWLFANKKFYLNGLVSSIFRGTFQIAYIGYYNDSKAYRAIGYSIPSDRKVITDRLAQYPPVSTPKLQVSGPKNADADVVIVGSGAGASIMAHTILSKNDGRKVVMVERGIYVPRNERKQDNEMD